MMKHEYFELHKLLKERIKGRIYVGFKDGSTTVNINSFNGINYKTTLNDISNVERAANEIERRFTRFIYSYFFVNDRKKGDK